MLYIDDCTFGCCSKVLALQSGIHTSFKIMPSACRNRAAEDVRGGLVNLCFSMLSSTRVADPAYQLSVELQGVKRFVSSSPTFKLPVGVVIQADLFSNAWSHAVKTMQIWLASLQV